jgi:CRISPR-associated protein Cst2
MDFRLKFINQIKNKNMSNEIKKAIASISICGEITLNLHSLNNEGSEGNQTLTRQLTVLDANGKIETVNGISGDMFKHIHAMHMVNFAGENNLPLSSYSKNGDPNRISAKEIKDYIDKEEKPNTLQEHVIDSIVNICSICDAHGVLITDKVGDNTKSSNTPRKSTIEFGWIVGIPTKNRTESYIHTKLVADAGSKSSGEAGNEGQNIFHRPANSGVYAFVCHIEVYRIGLNDISRKYPITEEERKGRYEAIIKSLLNSFLNPRGAMTSTQKPHITDFKGVVTTSNTLTPAPMISPLNSNYKAEVKTIVENLNLIENGTITGEEFEGLGKLSTIIKDLLEYKPYSLGSKKDIDGKEKTE